MLMLGVLAYIALFRLLSRTPARLQRFLRLRNSPFGVGLRREWYESDIPDSVDGFAFNLCDLLAARDSDQVRACG